MSDSQTVLDFYSRPGPMTDPGEHAALFDALPGDIGELAKVVQGLLLHEHWAGAYGQTLSSERRDEGHLRSVKAMLDQIIGHDPRPLGEPRAPEDRLIGNCRDFSLLTTAILRRHGAPARARCGFAAYFEPGRFVDHWVCEVWNGATQRWMMVDAQLDELQCDRLKPDFDVLDTPRDRFLVAADAWTACRTGEADPKAFGIFDMWGLWFIAGNLLRDTAALARTEMLPWDVWGAMSASDEELDAERLALFDTVAALGQEGDDAFDERAALYAAVDRLRVPDTVFNAIRGRPEAV